MNFKIKNAIFSNIQRKEEQDKKSRCDIKNLDNFPEVPEKFEEKVKQDLFKDLEHKKIEHPYVEPQVQDAEAIEIESKKENEEFDDLFLKYKEIDNAATEQKKENDIINLIDDVLDESNPSNTMKTETEDIFIDDLFADTDQKDIKKVSEDDLQDINLDQNEVLFVDLLKEQPGKIGLNPWRLKEGGCIEMTANSIKKNIKGGDKKAA